MDNDYIVKPVYKALQVLKCLGEENRELALSEICYLVDIPKTTVFRYLYTLRASGLVVYDPVTDLYRLSLRVWELGQSPDHRVRVCEIAKPVMQELRNHFNETVNLGMIEDGDVVYLEMVESRRSLRTHAKMGSRDPVYSTALGKAILAFMPEEQWSHHLPAEFVPRTPRTLKSLAALKQDLILTHSRGYARDDGENELGSRCLSAPIVDHRSQVAAAVSLSAPTVRLSGRLEKRAAAAVVEAAAAISRHLSH